MAKKQKLTPKKAAAAGIYSAIAIDDVLNQLARIDDPDEVLKAAGVRRADLRKLESDDEISGALETRRESVCGTAWQVYPYSNRNQMWLYNHIAEHIDSILRCAWNAIPYGYSVMEIIYEKRDDGKIGIKQVNEPPIEWFEPRINGDLWFYPPTVSGQQITRMNIAADGMPIVVDQNFKFFLTTRNRSVRNPYGEALLSRLYWPWFFRHNGWRFWMRFLERFADPLLLGKVDDPAGFVEALTSLGMEAVVAVGTAENVSAVTPALSGEFEILDSAICRRVQKLVLGQTMTTDIGDSGSYAAAAVHNAVRDDKRRADCRLLQLTAQRVVNALWAINGFSGDPPDFVFMDDRDLSLDRVDRDVKLVQSGILRLTKRYILARYDFDPEDFEMVEADEMNSADQKNALPNDEPDAPDDDTVDDEKNKLERSGDPTDEKNRNEDRDKELDS